MVIARFVVRRRRLLFALWAAAGAALLPLAAGVERSLETSVRVPGSGSHRADSLLAARFASPFGRYAVLVVRGLPAPSTPSGRGALERITAAVREDAAVAGTFSVLDAPDTLFVGAAGGTFVVVGLRGAAGAPM